MNGPDPDARRVAALLATVAASHEPDRARIVRRMGGDPARSATAPPAPPAPPEIPRHRRRLALPALAAAAAAVVAVAVAVGIGAGGPDPRDAATVAPGPSPVSDSLPPPASPSPRPVTGTPVAPAPQSDPDRRTPAPPPTPTPPAPIPGARPSAAAVGVTPVAAGTAVTLPATADWVATVRRDGRSVQTKRAVLGSLGVTATGADAGRDGPFRLSWSGGSPEQDHTDATGWLAVGAGGRVEISLPATSAPATLTLYLGTRGADAVVTGSAQAVVADAGSAGGTVLTVDLPASGAAGLVVVTPRPRAAGGYVGLAAAELR